MGKEEIMDLTVVCRSFPQLPLPQIQRENILDTIDTIFEGDTQLLVIEGGEGIGKTTLLAQHAKKYPHQTFSLFIKPTSRWTYDPQLLLLDLCSQIYWKLHHKELRELSQIDDGFLRVTIFQLQRLTRQKPLYFLIDGLEDIPEDETGAREAILDMLPFGLSGFRFLLTGDLRHLSPLLPPSVHAKNFPLAKFTFDETIKYVEDLTEDRNEVEELHHICRGTPGLLASIRRIVLSGTALQELLEDLPGKLPQLFELEWQAIDANDENLRFLLAILAHSLARHTLQELARLTHLPAERVLEIVQGIGFLVISSQDDSVSFVSEAFRKFAAKRLQSLKEQASTSLIEDLLRTPDTQEALTYLPGYLKQAGRYDALLDYLSPEDHFLKIVEYNHSLGPVRQWAELGINTALQLHRNEDLIRFCMQRATIEDFEHAEVWRSEVEARMALHDYEAALALAQGTEIKEDRLHLLAVIAKVKREQELPLEPELLEQMRQLYAQIDLAFLEGERAIDIASDLIYSLPELAVEMVEKATHADTDASARDWAFAKLTLAAFRTEWKTSLSDETLDHIQSHIENPTARRFSHAATFLFRKSSAQEVLAQVAAVDVTDRLNLLRLWAGANRRRSDAIDVVDATLKLIIQTTSYSPNARILRDLAEPLPYAPDQTRVKQLVGILDSQKDLIEGLGPTDDYVRLQLLLAQTESAFGDDFETVLNRLIEIYFYICDIDDLAMKTLCLARLADVLATIDPKRVLEVQDQLHSAVTHDLQEYLERLLEVTANHYYMTQGILQVLARNYQNQALSLAMALNIEPRRDQALIALVSSAIQDQVQNIDWDFITQILQQISHQDGIDNALLIISNELTEISSLDEGQLPPLVPLLGRMGEIQDAEVRCRACSLAYTVLTRHDRANQYASLASHLLEQASNAWQTIDNAWNRVNAGFALVKVLANISHEQAKTALDRTEAFKKQILLEVPTTAAPYLACLRLAIRAYSGLLVKDLLRNGDRERLTSAIDRVPSLGVRAELWGELALRHYIHHHIDMCKRIVNEHVKPLLEDIQTTSLSTYHTVLSTVAPALYCAHALTALEQVAKLPQPHRDRAYWQICTFLLRKLPASDPYETLWEHDYQLTYDEMVDLCSLLGLIEVDSTIAHMIESIATSVIAGRQKNRFSKQQLQAIIDRLKQIIPTKFPSPRYIQHNGYAILARAQITRIRRTKPEEWLPLLDEARKIPNLSDKAFVLSELATWMPRESSHYKEVLKEAKETVDMIPVRLEKMWRYQHLAKRAFFSQDSSLSKQCIEEAMSCTPDPRGPTERRTQRNLIDLAYLIDTEYASFLASRLDDDPARTELKQQVRVLEAKQHMEHSTSPAIHEKYSVSDYTKAAIKSLGALNAGRISTVHVEHTRTFILAAAKHPLEQTYPTFAWAIENAIRRFAHTDQAKTHLRPIYLATLLGVELAGKMALRSSAQFSRTKHYMEKPPDDASSIIIRPGNREAALQVLSTWFEHEVTDYLILCDAFFGPEDLEVLKLLNAVNPRCKVQILTSRKHQLNQGIRQPWEETYRDYWRLKLSDQNPPPTDIIIVGTQTKHDSPVHDRWWLTRGGGLRVGTSFNSLGLTKTSEISRLSPEEAETRETEINQYLHRWKQEHEGERLLYTTFNL